MSCIFNITTDSVLGGIDRVHRECRSGRVIEAGPHISVPGAELVFRASHELETIGKIGYKTLQLIQEVQGLDGNPLYAMLQEVIYCQR
jgi:hypothetical protein